MSEISFSTETIKITGTKGVIGHNVTILDKSVCKSYTANWQYFELAAVIAMIIAEGSFNQDVDDYLFHIAMNALRRTPGLVLF